MPKNFTFCEKKANFCLKRDRHSEITVRMAIAIGRISVALNILHSFIYRKSSRGQGKQGRIQDFFRRGCTRLLLYFNTNKPLFFCRIPVVLENRRSSQGGAHPLHPPPRSAPGKEDGNFASIEVSMLMFILI